MKRYIMLLFVIMLLITSSIPLNAYAIESTEDDSYITQEEFDSLEHVYSECIQTYSTSLIKNHQLGIAKNGKTLIISGYTMGTEGVKKCGFTEIVIERKKANENNWSEYIVYKNLYSDSTKYNLSKSVTVENGYQYRVKAIHYAKKTIFLTEKIEATTGYLTF